ncbi:MAG: Polysacc synt protein [Bacteroidetes bacterium]|nr:Polysacc synt protein [Bacteroidota bacterium]
MFRDIVKSVAKNTSIMYMQQLITWASTFLLMFFLPRYLGPVEYGRLFLGTSIVGIFMLIVQYGGNYLVAKSVSRAREKTGQLLVDAIGFRFVFGVVSLICLVVLAYLADYPPSVRTVLFICGSSLLWQGGMTVLYSCFQGHELMQYTSAGAITERVFVGVVGVAVLLMGANAVVFAVVLLIAGLLNFLLLASSARKIVPSIPRFNLHNAIQQIKDGVPYFLFTTFAAIYYRIDSVMLSKMAPEQVVGWYGGAFRLFETLNFFPYIFTVAVFPILSRLWEEGEHIHKRTTQKSLEFMIVVGVLVSVLVMGFADKFIQILYGLTEYSPSVILLQILSAGLLILYIDMVLGTTLLSSDKQSQLSVTSLIMIPLKAGLNFVLIPYYQSHYSNGGIGAAIATFATELCVMFIYLYVMPRQILQGFRISVVSKSLLAGILMAGSIFLIRQSDSLWVIAACVGPVVYALALFAMKTFEPAEEVFLRSVLAVRSVDGFRSLLRKKEPGAP